MKLFGRGEVTQKQLADELARVDARLSAQDAVIRALEAEQLTLHQQVRKWMRRAVAAEGRAQVTGAAPVAQLATPPLRGARLRRWMAQQQHAVVSTTEPVVVAEEEPNGLHP